jgi:hypothetical protein
MAHHGKTAGQALSSSNSSPREKGPGPPAMRDEIAHLVASQGYTLRQAATALGVSRSILKTDAAGCSRSPLGPVRPARGVVEWDIDARVPSLIFVSAPVDGGHRQSTEGTMRIGTSRCP